MNVNFIDQEYVLFSTLVHTSVNTDCVMTKDLMDTSLDKRVSFSCLLIKTTNIFDYMTINTYMYSVAKAFANYI